MKSAFPLACCMVEELGAAKVDSLKIRITSLTFCRFIVDGSSAFKGRVGAIINRSFFFVSCHSRNALNDAVSISGLESLLFRSG